MLTQAEHETVDQLLGDLQRRPGVAEELIAGAQVELLLSQLYEHMQGQGLAQADLARAMGVHRRQVLRWLRGDGAIRAETLIALGRHVGLRLDARWAELEVEMPSGTNCATVEVSAAPIPETSTDLALAA